MLVYPKTKHGIVSRLQGIMYNYQGWPSVARGDDGTLFAVASGYRIQHVCPFGKSVMYISKNEGETWSPPIIVNDTALDDRDAGIVNLGNGKLLLTWFIPAREYHEVNLVDVAKNHYSNPDETNAAIAQISSFHDLDPKIANGGSFVRLSRDNGMTWSEAVHVPVTSPHGPSIMSDGSLIYLGKEFLSQEPSYTPECIACCRSTDDGMTWNKLAEITIPEGFAYENFHEPHVIELSDGTLLGAIRAQNGSAYHGFTTFICKSYDKGLTWTVPRSLDVSGAPPHLLLHSSGAVVCVIGRRESPFGERALVSRDNGDTWDEYVLRDDAADGDLGYPASVELSDGSIFTLYYQKYTGDSKPSILYTKWRLD